MVFLLLWERREKPLEVHFLDVGQGDAILIETPNQKQILIDGGRNRSVVSHLGKLLPFGDRDLDVLIATHPDADHIGGLPEVLDRYEVLLYLEPGVRSENGLVEVLERKVSLKVKERLLARQNLKISFGDGVELLILFPNQDVSNFDTNDASIVAKLSYGETSFLLTGDAGFRTENILLNSAGSLLDSDVLKAGHHGSKNSSSPKFVSAVSPEYAVISAGKDNSYGHPHQEVLKIFEDLNIKIRNTAKEGTITFKSDGKEIGF